MSRLAWRPFEVIEFGTLSEARRQAHYATQWLARVARAYIPVQPDSSHINFGWDDRLDGLSTHPLPDLSRVCLSLPGPSLVLMKSGASKPSDLMLLRGHSNRDAYAWLAEQMRVLGYDPTGLDEPVPWSMPEHAIAQGGQYRSTALDAGLSALVTWFANAERSLCRIREDYAGRGFAVSPVRCWPHRFDMATLIHLDQDRSAQARSVNVGLSPGDESYDEPYFYVSPWPSPSTGPLPPLPPLGSWHTEGFLAAVAPATRILASKDAQTETEAFLYLAVEAAMTTLSHL